MYFSYFLNYAPPKPSEMENYGMVLAFFGNHISKCNRLSKNIRPIQAIEVLHRLRNKQKHYLIYQETPCICLFAEIYSFIHSFNISAVTDPMLTKH